MAWIEFVPGLLGYVNVPTGRSREKGSALGPVLLLLKQVYELAPNLWSRQVFVFFALEAD